MLLMFFPKNHQPFRNPATVLDSMTCKVYIIENKPCRVSLSIVPQKLSLPKEQSPSVLIIVVYKNKTLFTNVYMLLKGAKSVWVNQLPRNLMYSEKIQSSIETFALSLENIVSYWGRGGGCLFCFYNYSEVTSWDNYPDDRGLWACYWKYTLRWRSHEVTYIYQSFFFLMF